MKEGELYMPGWQLILASKAIGDNNNNTAAMEQHAALTHNYDKADVPIWAVPPMACHTKQARYCRYHLSSQARMLELHAAYASRGAHKGPQKTDRHLQHMDCRKVA